MPGWVSGPGLRAPEHVLSASPGCFTHTGAGDTVITRAGSCLGPTCNHLSSSTHFVLRLIDLGLCWVLIAACRPSSVAVSRGYPLVAVHRLLTVVVSLVEEHRL